ncbi:MAG: T9SS type A sorting domain-containing protein [Ignavibacteriaceae bacterium]|nr:T9SS type A sorting domain-containing protein [Ignavibacteriaceae bacterium]
MPDRYLTDIAIAPSNASTVYVTIAGFGSSHLFKSTDAGQNWIDIGSSLPDAPAFSVIVDPLDENKVFFGNDITVYASIDAGSTWSEYSNGLPEAVFVYDLNILASNHKLRVATHGNGVYEADLLVPVETNSIIANNFQLYQNYPNPFNPTTKIEFRIADFGFVSLKVYDVLGNEVATLVNEEKPVGEYEVEFNGEGLTSGIYFYKLNAGNYIETKKMILLK